MWANLGWPGSRLAVELMMKKWKWIALTLSGGVLLQGSACVTDFAYYLINVLANELLTQALTGATVA